MEISDFIGKHTSPTQWLAQGNNFEREFEFPRKDENGQSIRLRMRILNRSQESEAHAQAHVRTVAMLNKKGAKVEVDPAVMSQTLYNSTLAEEVLFRAVCDETGKQLFPDIKTLQHCLTSDEMEVLISEYNLTRNMLGPIKLNLSEESLEAWTKLIKEDMDAAIPFFTSSSQVVQLQLLHYLVKQLKT